MLRVDRHSTVRDKYRGVWCPQKKLMNSPSYNELHENVQRRAFYRIMQMMAAGRNGWVFASWSDSRYVLLDVAHPHQDNIICASVVFLVNFRTFISQTHDIRFALFLSLNSFPHFLSPSLCCRLSCSSPCLVFLFVSLSSYSSSLALLIICRLFCSSILYHLFYSFISILFAYVSCFFRLSLKLLMYPATLFYLSIASPH